MDITIYQNTIEYDDSGLWGYVRALSSVTNLYDDIYIVRYNNQNPYTYVIVPDILSINSIQTEVKGTYDLFNEDESIEKIEFSSGIEVIGDCTCYKCPNLQEVKFNNNLKGVKIIGNYCFWYCDITNTIILPDSLNDIGDGSFCNNYDLKIAMFPDSLFEDREVGNDLSFNIFRNDPNLTILVNRQNEQGIIFLSEHGYNYQIIGEQIHTISGGNEKYFLAGVANAEIFDGDNLFATAKTLIDSSITMGVSAEDIRAGQGAKLYGKYFHTSTFDLKMTNAMFSLEYIAANVGAEVEYGGDILKEEIVKCVTDNLIEISELPKPLRSGDDIYFYYKEIDESDYKYVNLGKIVNDKNLHIADLKENTLYCVKYIYTAEGAKKIVIPADYIPKTLSVFLTANLYKGDSSNPQIGMKAGTITIKIPRFLLSGSQEISMSMTGSTTMTLEGSALAVQEDNCSGCIYAEIIENIFGRTLNDIKELKVKEGDDVVFLRVGEKFKLTVFGKYKDSYFCKMDNTKLSFNSPLETSVSVDSSGTIFAHQKTDGFVIPILITIKELQNSACAVVGVVVG